MTHFVVFEKKREMKGRVKKRGLDPKKNWKRKGGRGVSLTWYLSMGKGGASLAFSTPNPFTAERGEEREEEEEEKK